MSAGTGIRHTKYNGKDGEAEIIQIWILPTRATVLEPTSGAYRLIQAPDRCGQLC
jgi:redox-sensitive bicupin YhaK (pirin superfamily)